MLQEPGRSRVGEGVRVHFKWGSWIGLPERVTLSSPLLPASTCSHPNPNVTKGLKGPRKPGWPSWRDPTPRLAPSQPPPLRTMPPGPAPPQAGRSPEET